MALIYITGAPGAGKSTLQKELNRRGFEVHDLDDADLGGPHNKATGELVVIPPAEERTQDWFDAHEWRIYTDAIEELRRLAKDKNIIICGVAASDGDILHFFDKVFYLDLDNETLAGRIRSRTDNDYGHNEFELNEILERKHSMDKKYASLNVIHIDATNSSEEVADEVLSLITTS